MEVFCSFHSPIARTSRWTKALNLRIRSRVFNHSTTTTTRKIKNGSYFCRNLWCLQFPTWLAECWKKTDLRAGENVSTSQIWEPHWPQFFCESWECVVPGRLRRAGAPWLELSCKLSMATSDAVSPPSLRVETCQIFLWLFQCSSIRAPVNISS